MTEMTNPLGSRNNFRCHSNRYRAVWTAAILAPRISQALMDPPIWKFSVTRCQLDRFLSNQRHRDVWLKQWIYSQKWLHLELKAPIGPRRWFLKWLSQNLWPTKKSFDLKPRRTRIRNDPEQDEGVQTNPNNLYLTQLKNTVACVTNLFDRDQPARVEVFLVSEDEEGKFVWILRHTPLDEVLAPFHKVSKALRVCDVIH